MRCPKCGNDVPADALYCPHCVGDEAPAERTRRLRAAGLRGGLFGGVLGALGGALVWWLMGPQRGVPGIALSLVFAGVATGLVLGLARSR